MVYGIVLLINFAHGDILMIGAYVGYFLLSTLGASPGGMFAAFGAAMVICACFGVSIERLAYSRLEPRRA